MAFISNLSRGQAPRAAFFVALHMAEVFPGRLAGLSWSDSSESESYSSEDELVALESSAPCAREPDPLEAERFGVQQRRFFGSSGTSVSLTASPAVLAE